VADPAASSSRRSYGLALALLAVGGLLLLVGYSMRWASADVPLLDGSADAVRAIDFSGRDLLSVAAVSGWIALAATAGILATRSWGRTFVGVVALLAGVVGLAGAVWFAVARSGLVDAAAHSLAGSAGTGSSQPGLGWLVAGLGGVLVLVAAIWTVVAGSAWPTMGARYERKTGDRQAISAWDAQDMGQDPTDDLVE
jgi:uncharacterized membrane protein (TIGR02234 family)